MNALAWLAKHQLQSIVHREHDWVFAFDHQTQLVVSCLWRLLEDARIRFTSEDDGHQFGLKVPVDAAAELNSRLANSSVEAVKLHEGTLDLELQFSSEHILQVVPDSSGYEAWVLDNGRRTFIAVGGGELAIIDGKPALGQ